MSGVRSAAALGLVLAVAGLAGCGDFNIGFGGKERAAGSSADWVKPGADSAETAAAYRQCLGLAGTAVGNEADIDQDIAATRSADLQRESLVQIRAQDMQDKTRQRDRAIVASCMQQKGFAEPR